MPHTSKPPIHAVGAQKARITTPRLLLFVSVFLNFVAFITILRRSEALSGIFSQRIFFEESWYDGGKVSSEDTQIGACAPLHSQPPAADSTPVPVNPWRSLTIPELADIRAWLEDPARDLNLTEVRSSKTSDNIIFLIEAYQPAKDAAIAYLASPSPATLPERHARVTIHHGGWAVPVVKDYLVGPLPVGAATSMRPLTEIYHNGEIPFNARGVSHLDEMGVVLAELNAPIADILQVRCHYHMHFLNHL